MVKLYRRQINVMISTDPCGQGGVASVVNTMLAQPFSAEWNILHITSHRAGSKLSLLCVFLLSIFKLTFLRLKGKPGIAHVHMASRGSFSRKYVLAKVARWFGFKVIIHLHGAQFDQFYEQECSVNKQRKIEQLFNTAESVVVLGQQWKDWICKTFPSGRDVRIIYNPGPAAVCNRAPSPTPTILFLGRLGERKGVHDLLYALIDVVAKIPSVKLVLGGDGDIPHYQKLAETLGVSSNVEFKGWVGAEEKFSLLSSASVFVLPSYNEGFPVGIIEAMACEVPIVATTVGGIPDAITPEQEGVLIQAGDKTALSQALMRVLTDRELAEFFSHNAKQKYLNNFSAEAVMPIWHDLYMEILNAKP